MIGTSLCVGDIPEPALVANAISKALEKSHARRRTDQIAALLVLMTPHWVRHAHDACQLAMRESRSLQVWGGICKGLVVDGQIQHQRPAVAVAIIPARPERLHKASLSFHLGHLDPPLPEPLSDATAANDDDGEHSIGLVNYSFNEETFATIQHGRLSTHSNSIMGIQAHRIQTFDSLGLQPLCAWISVDKAIGSILHKAGGQVAARALACPVRNTQPVALRLGVQRAAHVDWIPVIDIHADGTLHLASPVQPGDLICLAARTADCAQQEVQAWAQGVTPAFRSSTRRLILLAGGMERSPLCHSDDPEWEVLRHQWPDTPMIGGLGQAAWVRSPDLARRPSTHALNHRLAASFLLF